MIGHSALAGRSDVGQDNHPKEMNMNEDTSASSGQVRQAGPIVVGVDGSDSSRRALQWAVEEGAAHGNSVLAIRTYSIPALATADPGFVLQPVDIQELANAWRKVLDGEVAAASRRRDAVKIDAKVIEGPAARALIDASQKASTLVVGSRGLGGFVGLLLGSVSQQCVTHAHCPVVVIR